MAVAIVPNNQIFNAYLVWGDQQFDLVFMGTRLPTTWLVTLDAIVSVSLPAGVALFYRWYGKRWREPDELTKIIIGSAFSIGGMLCLFAAAATTAPGEKIGLFWPVMFHVLNCIGFAHMLPVSLALFAKLAPKAINATVIGLYYLAFFAGQFAGRLGRRLARDDAGDPILADPRRLRRRLGRGVRPVQAVPVEAPDPGRAGAAAGVNPSSPSASPTGRKACPYRPSMFSGFTTRSNVASSTRPSSSPASLRVRPFLVGIFGDLGGIVVADLGRQRGDQHQRAVHQLGDRAPRPAPCRRGSAR